MGFPTFLRIASLSKAQFNLTRHGETSNILDVDDELLRILSQKFGFSYELVSPSDNEYGTLLPSGNWTGLVGMIANGQADIIVSRLSVSEVRTAVIDFSTPYHIDHLTFATRHSSYTASSTSYLKPFSLHVWLAILASVITAKAVSYLLFEREHFQRKLALRISNLQSPKSAKEYVLKSCCMISEMLLRYFYTALLLSFLTFPPSSGVRNVAQLSVAIADGIYRCVTVPGAYYGAAFVNSTDLNLIAIGRSLGENEGSYNIEETLRDTKRRLEPAFVLPEGELMTLKPHYFVSDDGFFIDLVSVGMRKNFCCKNQLDKFVNVFRDSGIYFKLMNDFAFAKSLTIIANSATVQSLRALSIHDLRGVFTLLVVGYISASILFFLELILQKKQIW